MRCPGFPEDDYAFYALGTLGDAEKQALDEHLTACCETCSTELTRARNLWCAVGAAAPSVRPPRAVRARLLESIGPSSQPRLKWWQAWGPAFAGATAVIVCVAILAVFILRRMPPPEIAYTPVYEAPVVPQFATPVLPAAGTARPTPTPPPSVDGAQARLVDALNADLARERDRSARLTAELEQQRTLLATSQNAARDAERNYQAALQRGNGQEEMQTRLAAAVSHVSDLERQVSQYRILLETERRRTDQATQFVSMLSDPGLRMIRLRGTEKGQSIEGHAVIAGGSQMVFYATQVPPLPANRTYQLWLLRSAGPAIASAGTFRPDASSRAMLQLRNPTLLSGVTALAITDEPSGGSVQPTGHKWMIGS